MLTIVAEVFFFVVLGVKEGEIFVL